MRKRLKRITINPEAFLHIMADNTAWRVAQGVPKGARLTNTVMDPHTGNLVIFIEHESFEEIELAKDVAPMLPTEFLKIK